MSEATMQTVLDKLDEIAVRLRRLEVEKGDGPAWLTMRDVCELTTLSQREIYRRLKDEVFPAPMAIGEHRRAWPREVIQKWMKQQQRAKAS